MMAMSKNEIEKMWDAMDAHLQGQPQPPNPLRAALERFGRERRGQPQPMSDKIILTAPDMGSESRTETFHGEGIIFVPAQGQPQQEPTQSGGEVCFDCGKPIEYVWTAPNDLWLRFANENDLLCIPCFDKRVWAAGVFVRWVPHVEVKGQQQERQAGGHHVHQFEHYLTVAMLHIYKCACGITRLPAFVEGYQEGVADAAAQAKER